MKSLIVFLVLLSTLQSRASEKVEFVANRIHSLMVFVTTISGDPHGSVPIKELFEKSSFNNSESRKKIEQFEKLDKALQRYIAFEGTPAERKNGISVEKLIWTQSAFAENLNDLMQRTQGLIQYDEQTQFLSVMKYFEPIHDQLLWNVYSKELERSASEFKNKAKIWNLDEMFGKAVKFYNSKWPENQKFRISLFPIPKDANQSSASSYGAFESVGVIIGAKDLEGQFGVIFHEMCHSLYDAQDLDFQNQISKWYGVSRSPYAKMAYGWMNETLATILGNGWAYFRITGKIDKSSWYNQPTIEGFSKALYPEVLKYLNNNQTMDQKFVETSIQIFQKTFPESIRELSTLLTNLSFFTDGSFGSTRTVAKDLRSLYRIQTMGSSSPINNEESLLALKENQTATVFMLAHWNNIKQFEVLKTDYSVISNLVSRAQKGKNLLGLFDIDGRKFVISLINENQGYDFVIRKLKALKKIDKLNEFLDLDTI